jgi:hypothetical protein
VGGEADGRSAPVTPLRTFEVRGSFNEGRLDADRYETGEGEPRKQRASRDSGRPKGVSREMMRRVENQMADNPKKRGKLERAEPRDRIPNEEISGLAPGGRRRPALSWQQPGEG